MDALYTVTNNETEYARLEDQAAGLAELMDNRLIHAPLQQPPLQLIDVGCGSGTVTRHLASKYPIARVYGIDLSPVPTGIGHDPPNVEFLVGDMRQMLKKDARFVPGSTDFVFSRMLALGMTDWPGYVRDMASLLRSGGWVEMQEYTLDWYLHGSYCSADWEWLRVLHGAAREKGRDLRCGTNMQVYMEQAGLVDISVKAYRVPMGTWLVGERPETKRIGEHAAREYGVLFCQVVSKMLQGLGYTKEKIEEFQMMTLKDQAAQEGKEKRFYVTIGRKP
ncbi:MAG: hypothetical protein Q9224_001691 [Gallowayella concinna]